MDDDDRGIEVSDELYAALTEQAEANQRTPEKELCAILTAAIEAASDDAS
ncbi:hypothetical protein AB9K29_16760 [Phaeobacter italicus]|jgi:hypothetical protein